MILKVCGVIIANKDMENDMVLSARSAKAKGSKFEKKIVDTINKDSGWEARKQPGSGIFRDFPNDVYVVSPTGERYIIECKKWKHGWRTGDKAKQGADFLLVERDHGSPKCYLEYDMLLSLMKTITDLHQQVEQLKGSKDNEE